MDYTADELDEETGNVEIDLGKMQLERPLEADARTGRPVPGSDDKKEPITMSLDPGATCGDEACNAAIVGSGLPRTGSDT